MSSSSVDNCEIETTLFCINNANIVRVDAIFDIFFLSLISLLSRIQLHICMFDTSICAISRTCVCHANTPHTVLIEIIIENKNWDRRKPSVLSTIVYTEIRKTDRHFHSIVHCSNTCALVNMMQQDIDEHSTSIHVRHNSIF